MDAEQMKIYPDYSISTEQVFTNLSVTSTKQRLEEGSHSFLEGLDYTDIQLPAKQPYSCMPTWVPKYLDEGYTIFREIDFDMFQTMKRDTRRDWMDSVSFESSPAVKNGVMVVKGIRLELNLDWSLGTFSRAGLMSFTDMEELNHTLTAIETFYEHSRGSERLLACFWEACLVDRHILETTIDSANGEEAAAQALRDVMQLLRQAKSGDSIPAKEFKDFFYLPVCLCEAVRMGQHTCFYMPCKI